MDLKWESFHCIQLVIIKPWVLGNNLNYLNSGIIRRMIFVVELILKAMAYLTCKRESEPRKPSKSKKVKYFDL